MRFHEIIRPLVENTGQRLLYHASSGEGVVGIMQSDYMTDEPFEGPAGASLSRNFEWSKRYAYGKAQDRMRDVNKDAQRMGYDGALKLYQSYGAVAQFAEWTADNKYGSGGAVIIFDWNKLATTHNIQPYDEPGLEEFEERIMSDGAGIRNVKQSIVGINVND